MYVENNKKKSIKKHISKQTAGQRKNLSTAVQSPKLFLISVIRYISFFSQGFLKDWLGTTVNLATSLHLNIHTHTVTWQSRAVKKIFGYRQKQLAWIGWGWKSRKVGHCGVLQWLAAYKTQLATDVICGGDDTWSLNMKKLLMKLTGTPTLSKLMAGSVKCILVAFESVTVICRW